MGLVHDDHIPTRGQRLIPAHRVAGQKGNARQHELRSEKRIFFGVAAFARRAPRLVVDAEPKIKSPQQFDEPLVGERLRHQDQDSPRPSHRQQALQNQTRLDRLP